MSRSVHLTFISAIALVGAAGASASAQTQPESRVVTYGELNLNSAAGADALINRIDSAAESVCGDRHNRTSVRVAANERACEYETAENAVEDVAHPVVTARYYGSGYAVVEEGSSYYDPRLDPASPQYDATMDPNSQYYDPA